MVCHELVCLHTLRPASSEVSESVRESKPIAGIILMVVKLEIWCAMTQCTANSDYVSIAALSSFRARSTSRLIGTVLAVF